MGVVALVALAPGRAAGQPDGELCSACHDRPVGIAAASGGHAGLDCAECHRDRRPGRFARRHRSIPRCHDCHDTAGHPPHAGGRLPTGDRSCLRCHEAHGSANVDLVRPQVRARRTRLEPVRLTSEAGLAPGGLADPTAPGTGLCEICHRRTAYYRADGTAAPHFTESCVLCHLHGAGFLPVVADQNCGVCHAGEATRFAKPSRHSEAFACSGCHAEVTPPPGPGHRSTPACETCHSGPQTHAPAGTPPFPCVHCHDPHGTDNTHLVLDTVATPQGTLRPIRFDNLLGRADGGFASASAPGTGICEICHTQTRFYRADGTGEPHFTVSCLPCHLHSAGFAPP